MDRLLARFVEIQELKGLEMPDESVQRVWMVRSCRYPPLSLSVTPLHITRMDPAGREIDGMRNPFVHMRPRYLRKTIRVLNLAVPDLNWRIGGRILESLSNLHTIILHVPNLDFAGALAHVDRIIYSYAPMLDEGTDEYFDALPCRPVTVSRDTEPPTELGSDADDERPLCSRKHTRKLVVNLTEPDFDSPVMKVFTAPVKEIVIILHPWDEPVARQRAVAFDPRQCIVSLAVRGLHIGARVTIVNPEQLDFETGARLSTFPHGGGIASGDAKQELRAMVGTHAAIVPTPLPEGATFDIERQLRIIETPEYVKEIGWEEFEIEACLRCPTVESIVKFPEP